MLIYYLCFSNQQGVVVGEVQMLSSLPNVTSKPSRTGEKNLWSTPLDYSIEYFWTTLGLFLEHFWSTHLSLVVMTVASFFLWSTFGVLLDYFWITFGVPHPSLVLMTVASFLLLRAHVVPCTNNKKLHAEPNLPITNYCIVQLSVI